MVVSSFGHENGQNDGFLFRLGGTGEDDCSFFFRDVAESGSSTDGDRFDGGSSSFSDLGDSRKDDDGPAWCLILWLKVQTAVFLPLKKGLSERELEVTLWEPGCLLVFSNYFAVFDICFLGQALLPHHLEKKSGTL